MEEFTAIFERLVMCLSPIICAWMSYRSSVSQKKTKEFMDLQAKYNEQTEQIRKSEAEAQKKAIADMHTDIDNLRTQVKELSDSLSIASISERLQDLIQISKINFDYSTSMSQLISAVGDCIETGSPEDIATMRKDVARHKQFEHAMASELLKLIR